MDSKENFPYLSVILILSIILFFHTFSIQKENFAEFDTAENSRDMRDTKYQEMMCLLRRTTDENKRCASIPGLNERPHNDNCCPKNFKDF